MKDEIKHIISGTSKNCTGTIIQTIASFLRRSETSSGLVKKKISTSKKKKTKNLIDFIAENNLWYPNINLENYISEGAETKKFTLKVTKVF